MRYLRERDVKHLLVDVPSVDREEGGREAELESSHPLPLDGSPEIG